MATVASLSRRHTDIVQLYKDNEGQVAEIQLKALEEVTELLESEGEVGPLDDEAKGRIRAFLEDRVTVFRFCRRAKFQPAVALKLLLATLTYRLNSPLFSPFSLVSPIPSPYAETPLFFFHEDLFDKFGRPAAILNLRHVKRTEDGELEALKEVIRESWEIGRRWLSDLSREDDEVKVQMVIIVDLKEAGLSNLEVELLPFFMDLLKNHFPGMVGAVYVMDYHWTFAGMWQVAKRILPNTALERILFPTQSELLEFFDEDHLLKEHGGKISYTYTPSNSILKKYSRSSLGTASAAYPSPSPSPSPSVSHSRNQSTDSLSLDTFHSIPSSPRGSRGTTPLPSPGIGSSASWNTGPGTLARRPSGLSMTTLKSARNSVGDLTSLHNSRSRDDTGGSGGLLRRVTSFAELQDRLMETQKAIESDDSSDEEASGEAWEHEQEWRKRERDAVKYAREVGEGLERILAANEGEERRGEEETADSEGEEADYSSSGESTATVTSTVIRSGGTSARSSRGNSRNASRAASNESSPNRKRAGEGEGFSTRAVRFSSRGSISPYNNANPYYGYPAFVPPRSLDPSGIPRPHYQRRRKRDLVRTLTYLAVLRFLAVHRNFKIRLGLIIDTIVRLSGLKWLLGMKETKVKKGVTWAEGGLEEKKNKLSPWVQTLDIRYLYAFLAFLLLRSEMVSESTFAGKVVLPLKVLDDVGSTLVKCATESPGLSSLFSGAVTYRLSGRRKRDVVRGLVGWGKVV